VEGFASVIDRYISNLTVYQTTHNGDLTKNLIDLVERTNLQRPQVAQATQATRATQITQATVPRKPYFMVRYETDEDFTGRGDIIEEIGQKFESRGWVAIAGMGSVGYALFCFPVRYILTGCRKSRIAIEYCYRFREKPNAHVFWVHCGNKARFEAAYQAIARAMEISRFQDPRTNTLQLVSDRLSDRDNGSWLMVLDNADDAGI
jgi:hypothetical protein